MKTRPLALALTALAFLLHFSLAAAPRAKAATLAADRWGAMTEEERYAMKQAEQFFTKKDFKAAKSAYEHFLQLYNKSAAASYALLKSAECTRQLGQVNTAAKEFRDVMDYYPDSPEAIEALYSVGVCFTQSGDADASAAAFEKVIDTFPKTTAATRARWKLVSIYWGLKKPLKSLDHLRFLAEQPYPDVEQIRSSALQRYTWQLLYESKFPEAYELAVKNQGKDAAVHIAAESWNTMQHHYIHPIYGDAGMDKRRSIAVGIAGFLDQKIAETKDHPGFKSINLYIARNFSAVGTNDLANKRYESLLTKFPDDDSIKFEFADFLLGIGKGSQARHYYQQTKDTYTGDARVAESFFREGNNKEAISRYRAMITRYPKNAAGLNWRVAEICQQSGMLPDAIAAFQLSQREPESLFRISQCQTSLKQYDTSLQTLITIMNFFPDRAAEALFKSGKVQESKGDKNAAINSYKKVCKNFLTTHWAGQAHQVLAREYGIEVTLGGAAKKKDE
ncbi:hypothetical protein LBMAG56_04860 [Verrucomicrobiota bacterium]|nr:hypothetical protein LBMAG56_04860 [Verrucomicrobiota bacterium]